MLQELDKQMLDVGPTGQKLPEVPTDSIRAPPATQKKKEEDDLAELEAWANA